MAAGQSVGVRVVVIGAGWAGLSTALQLVAQTQGQVSITLLDRRPYAGGRAFSFDDDATGTRLDNGQHVLLGCCDETVHFLNDLGMADAVTFQPLLSIPVYCDGRWSTIASAALPGPLHLWPTLRGYRHLSVRDRLRALRMAWALRADASTLDQTTFSDWLLQHGQSEVSIRRLWDLVGVSVLNTRAQDASAGQAVRAFQMAVMRGWKSARLGYFRVPLGDIGERAVTVLRAAGVDVMLGQAVRGFLMQAGRVTGVALQSGQQMEADVVVAATPPDALRKMLPDGVRDEPYFAQLQSLDWSPILNVHVAFDRPVFSGDVAAFAEATTQFVFNRGRLVGEGDGRLLSVSISAAQAQRAQPVEDVVRQVVAELRAAFPEAHSARVMSARAVWQPQATFLQAAGTGKLRRCNQTPVDGLFVAGDWTATGWPASLEGAIRSGIAAATAVLQSV